MKDRNLVHIVVVIVVVVLLTVVFVSINLLGAKEKKANDLPTTTTIKTQKVPPVFGDKIVDKENGYLLVDGENKEVKLKVFESVLGYKVDYLYELYTPVKINNVTLAIMNNEDSNVFLKIESLGENKYYDEYEDSLKRIYNRGDEVVGYNYDYKFFRGNGLYLKITKCMNENNMDMFKQVSLEYMYNSIKLN